MAHAVAYLLWVEDVMYKGGNVMLMVADIDRHVFISRLPVGGGVRGRDGPFSVRGLPPALQIGRVCAL
jgi:hypothetical protein